MTKNVLIKIKGVQQDDTGEMNSTETVVHGEYYFRNGSHYILYEETDRDSGKTIKNSLKYKGNMLELTRKGAVESRMTFESGRRHIADYATPFGMLRMETAASRILFSEEEECLQINAEYDLWTNGVLFSKCKLTIVLEPL